MLYEPCSYGLCDGTSLLSPHTVTKKPMSDHFCLLVLGTCLDVGFSRASHCKYCDLVIRSMHRPCAHVSLGISFEVIPRNYVV